MWPRSSRTAPRAPRRAGRSRLELGDESSLRYVGASPQGRSRAPGRREDSSPTSSYQLLPAAIRIPPRRPRSSSAESSGRCQGGRQAGTVFPRISFVDEAYPEMRYPTEEYRLLALFRFWNVIEHFFPYKDLLDQPWEKTLDEFIPRMQRASDATKNALAVAELVARLQGLARDDQQLRVRHLRRHTSSASAARPGRGSTGRDAHRGRRARVPRICASGTWWSPSTRKTSLRRREGVSKYIPASTVWSLHSKQARDVLRGAKDTQVVVTVRTQAGDVKEVTLVRSVAGATPSMQQAHAAGLRLVLPSGFGYVDFDRLTAAEADAAYAAVRSSSGLIVDLRGYVRSGALEVHGRDGQDGEGAVPPDQYDPVRTARRDSSAERFLVSNVIHAPRRCAVSREDRCSDQSREPLAPPSLRA